MALHERMILITCSGTIGNMRVCNANFDGAVGSPDLIRIVAEPQAKFLPVTSMPGLSSPLAHALIEQKTYGAVVPHIEAHHVVDLPVPRLDAATEQRIHELVERAAVLKAEANEALRLIRHDITDGLRLPTSFAQTYDHQRATGQASMGGLGLRLDSYYHIGYAGQAAQAIAGLVVSTRKLAEIATDIFEAPFSNGSMSIPQGCPT